MRSQFLWFLSLQTQNPRSLSTRIPISECFSDGIAQTSSAMDRIRRVPMPPTSPKLIIKRCIPLYLGERLIGLPGILLDSYKRYGRNTPDCHCIGHDTKLWSSKLRWDILARLPAALTSKIDHCLHRYFHDKELFSNWSVFPKRCPANPTRLRLPESLIINGTIFRG